MAVEHVRVVVVDDHESLRRLLRLNLELAGDVEVVGEADDGTVAVELAVSLVPDVLVVDLALPGMDGVAVVEAVRRRAPSVRVVVFTGWTCADREAEVLAAGAARYVVKTEIGEVVRAIREVAAERGSEWVTGSSRG